MQLKYELSNLDSAEFVTQAFFNIFISCFFSKKEIILIAEAQLECLA
jgi:hypothetical protein